MAGNFKNYITNNVGPSNTAVYSPSGVTSTVIGITMANLTGSPITAALFLKSGSANGFIVYSASIPNGGSMVPVGGEQKLVLESGDELYAWSNTSSSMDVIVSALEIS